MPPKGMKLSFRHKAWLYSIFSVLFFSGLLWVFLDYFNQNHTEEASRVLEHWLLKIHGAAAMPAMVILGTLIPIHIKRSWTANINRINGVVMISVNLLLIVTGYALYYAGSESMRAASHWIHIILGISLPAVIIWHVFQGRKKMRALKRHPKSSKRYPYLLKAK